MNRREARIFSAKYRGTTALAGPASAGALGVAGASASRWPHFLQNFASARFALSQRGQRASSRAPHSSQKAESPEFSAWQWEQIIEAYLKYKTMRTGFDRRIHYE